jgi:aryl-alcohol dehydrogenase-like predicted oxidoreductase
MPLDNYVTLGRSGLRVSPMCLGAMTFGEDWGWGSSVADTQAILDRFLERGGNFIDTANAYTKGHSEKIIGDHVGRHPSKRDRVVLATKFLSNLYRGDPNGGGAHRKAIVSACEQSLRRLQTTYIDLYWMHAWDATTPIEETLRALDDLVREGKVRYIGFSDTPAWKCAEAQTIARFRGWAPLIALQIEYSLLQRTVEGELIPMALELGLGVTPWSPLKSGVLSGKYTRDKHGHHDGLVPRPQRNATRWRRGFRAMARREEGEYSTYSTDEQRRQRAKDQARWLQNVAVEALDATWDATRCRVADRSHRMRQADHPLHAESIGAHAEVRAPRSVGNGHRDPATAA